MFASQERGATRKPFQKPNILRRKSKVVKLNTQKNNEFPELVQLSATSCDIPPTPSSDLVEQPQGKYNQSMHVIQAPKFGVVEICNKNQIDTSETLEIDGGSITIYARNAQIDNDGSHEFNNDSGQKFKCDVANCNKSFWTEARLQRHKNVHNKQMSKTPTILYCPVKKTDAHGFEIKCGRTFLIRNQLMKHLNEDHAAEDALFRCAVCERRFFWAGGARAHQAGACGRAFVCGWAGCGRVFRHPCRLREHARAHTGDRPYPCHYPNCGWSFRSASKLVRHARRHTGERRHACLACGRAFLRREHLRDHAARFHARGNTDHAGGNTDHAGGNTHHAGENTHHAGGNTDHAGGNTDHAGGNTHHAGENTHHAGGNTDHAGGNTEHDAGRDGCEKTLTNVNSVNIDVKKSHKKNENKPSAPKEVPINMREAKEVFVVGKHEGGKRKVPINMREAKEMFVMTLVDQHGLKNFDADVGAAFTASEQLMNESKVTSAAVEADVDETADVGAVDVGAADVSDEADLTDERCARTHCTWPLQREHTDYVEEDTQIEQSESSESNIYTVRSDLFLHGNVLINEDSEFIISRASTGDEGASAVEGEEGGTDATLGLIDMAHPTIDLMQEELMYADAVDESSFRVFLLNGEELT